MINKKNSNDLTHKRGNGILSLVSANKKALISFAVSTLTVIAVLVFWHITAVRIDIPYILPTPYSVLEALIALLPQEKFILAVLGSLKNVLIGFVLGLGLGAIAAFGAFLFYPIKALFAPFLKVVRATPVASFILLCIIWLTDNTASSLIAFLIVFPIVYDNVLTGLDKTDTALIEMADAYRLGYASKLARLYLPSTLPYLGSAALTSLGLAFKACVAAEALCLAENTVGYYIFYSKSMEFDTINLFAWTVTVIIMSLVIEIISKLIAILIKRRMRRSYGK